MVDDAVALYHKCDISHTCNVMRIVLLFKIRNRPNLLCIKENGYLERADSRTRDASRNYKLKSAKTAISALVFHQHSQDLE